MIKVVPLLVLRYNIIDGEILLSYVGFTDSVYDGIRVDNSEGFLFGTSDGETMGLI